jgi:alpha-2-macroglobulin-like protein
MPPLKPSAPNQEALTKAVKFIVGSRSGYGTFGNTQGTVLALKALTEYAKASRRAASDGTIEFYVGHKKVAEKTYSAGQKGNIVIAGLEEFVKEGKHKLKVKFKDTKEPLPYSVAISWNTTLPNSSKECAVNLTAKLAQTTANVGETVRLSVTLSNKKGESVPNPIAIIGIPAGFTAQPWQLKEMQEKNVFDYYEVTGNNIVLYYRGMKGLEVKNISFDLKAEVPGEYYAPASAAYLYYTNEHKSWTALEKVTVKKLAQN